LRERAAKPAERPAIGGGRISDQDAAMASRLVSTLSTLQATPASNRRMLSAPLVISGRCATLMWVMLRLRSVIGHQHRHDLVVHARNLRASHHLVVIEHWIEKADVVGKPARQQLVLLHDGGYLLAIVCRECHRR
jgi:hypothetical protein